MRRGAASVFGCEFVSAFAMRCELPHVRCERTACEVLGASDRLEMVRVAARTIAAEVIKIETGRNFADEMLIDVSMRLGAPSLGARSAAVGAVSVFVVGSDPDPAPAHRAW